MPDSQFEVSKTPEFWGFFCVLAERFATGAGGLCVWIIDHETLLGNGVFEVDGSPVDHAHGTWINNSLKVTKRESNVFGIE
jgi:hypothetical protein